MYGERSYIDITQHNNKYYIDYNDRYTFAFKGLKLVEAYVYRTSDSHYTAPSELEQLFIRPDGDYHDVYIDAFSALKRYIKDPKAYQSENDAIHEYNRKARKIGISLESRRAKSYSNPVLATKSNEWTDSIARSPYIIEYVLKDYDNPSKFGGFESAKTLTDARKTAYNTLWHWGNRPSAKIYKNTSKGRVLEGECNRGTLYGYTNVYYWKTKEGNFTLFKSGRIGTTKLTKENIGKM